MSYRSRFNVKIKANFAWVWYSFLLWVNPSFTNHLKFRWHHYKFCKRRGEVFLFQAYLSQWRKFIEEMLAKYPDRIIPSHGLYAILEMIRENKLEKLLTFLESQDIEQGMEIFINELNALNKMTPGNLEILSALKDDETLQNEKLLKEDQRNNLKNPDTVISEAAKIHGRTWVIAMQMHYEIFFNLKEYYALTRTRAKYIDLIKIIFRVGVIKTKYKDIDYNYINILEIGSGSEKGQLRRQLKQIVNNSSIFPEKIRDYVKDLLKKYFDEDF